jgi:1-pyrroline-5-carboxylate dehydrogenase
MTVAEKLPKVTYTTMSVEQADAFNTAFDEALSHIKRELGKDYPLGIAGEEVRSTSTAPDFSPNDQRIELGRFQQATAEHTHQAIAAAKRAFKPWEHTDYTERVHLMRQVAANFRERRFEIGALLSLEAGKGRLEAIGEVEEAADLITTYCDQIEAHDGYVIRLGQVSPQEINHSVLRPYGVWGVIAPFNFPGALATGMLAGALIAGNTVVFKPSHDTPCTGWYVYQMFMKAGLPEGAINFVTGGASEVGETMVSSRDVDGIVFTGSKTVGYSILQKALLDYPRPCIAEMGGKNPVIIMESADLQRAAVGTARAAFGYTGQKCSAASRAYIARSVFDEFVERLADYTNKLKVGDPTLSDTFMGPAINKAAYEKFKAAAETARKEGSIATGGRLIDEGDYQHGFYVEPTVVTGLPVGHRFFREELFLPFITLAPVDSLGQALDLANDSEFGLTAGIFTEEESEQRQFFDQMEAGVLYANREGGATTGAWPGIQSFGGWKGSGSSGKSALGPYYVQQFLREQSQTVVTR